MLLLPGSKYTSLNTELVACTRALCPFSRSYEMSNVTREYSKNTDQHVASAYPHPCLPTMPQSYMSLCWSLQSVLIQFRYLNMSSLLLTERPIIIHLLWLFILICKRSFSHAPRYGVATIKFHNIPRNINLINSKHIVRYSETDMGFSCFSCFLLCVLLFPIEVSIAKCANGPQKGLNST